MSGYKVPKGEILRLPIKNCSSINNHLSKRSFFTDQAQKKKDIPAPSKYAPIIDWSKVKRSEGSNWKNGSKKVTMTEMYMKIGKNDPAPNKYKPM